MSNEEILSNIIHEKDKIIKEIDDVQKSKVKKI